MTRTTLCAAVLASVSAFVTNAQITLEPIGTYETGIFDEGAAEIVAHDPHTQRLFVVNGGAAAIDVIDISDPTNPTLLFQIDVTPWGDNVNSVAVEDGLIAAAVEADPHTDPGRAVFFDADGVYLADVLVGALPDMIVFTPNGQNVLVAGEGEPNDDYDIDPLGTVAIIDVSADIQDLSQDDVCILDFTAYDRLPWLLRLKGIRIFGPGAAPSQDIEPEYIAVDHRSRYAYVTLQENNAIAVVDIRRKRIKKLHALGVKNHARRHNELDASDRDDAINIQRWPVLGMYMPDAIAAHTWRNQTFLLTANEGDARDYAGYAEEARIKDLELDSWIFPNRNELQEDEAIGRLTVTTANGDVNNDGVFERLYAYGARSFSIWSASGRLIYDSGDDFEQITAAAHPDDFNSTNDENDSFDSRSDAKGPEPEAITTGTLNGHTYAFIGLERISGIMVYDITNPHRPHFVTYVINRDFAGDPELGTAGDLGPEGMIFVGPDDSPNGEPLLVVANEVSGTTTIWQIIAD